MDVPVENVAPEGAPDFKKFLNEEIARQVEALICIQFLAVELACAVAFLVSWIIDKLGFGRHGIKAGSWAAAWQAAHNGRIQRTSGFACLQCWGVKGVPNEVLFLIGLITYVIVVVYS